MKLKYLVTPGTEKSNGTIEQPASFMNATKNPPKQGWQLAQLDVFAVVVLFSVGFGQIFILFWKSKECYQNTLIWKMIIVKIAGFYSLLYELLRF